MSRSLMLLEDPASGMGAPAHILGALARLPCLSSVFRRFSFPSFFSHSAGRILDIRFLWLFCLFLIVY